MVLWIRQMNRECSDSQPRVRRARLVATVTIQPRSSGPLAHVHQGEDEVFLVLDGRALFRIGREK
jgi:mannose-6-phosphate isomerase-like protein (cupin superfamily)